MMPPRLIADVNTLLAGVVGKPGSIAERLYRSFRRGQVRLVFDGTYLAELERVLDYEPIQQLGITRGLAFGMARDLLLLGEYYAQVPRYDWPSLPDPRDWYLLDLLFESSADGLVTQDKVLIAAGQKLEMPVFHLTDGPKMNWW
jgi:predicted nucleic acid-binding protein